MSEKVTQLSEPCIVIEAQETEIMVPRSTKLLYTVFMLFVYFVGGALKGQEGISFLDLLIITRSDIETGSLLLTCSALGLMIGPPLLGFLYDRYNNTGLLCMFIVSTGVMTFVIPWCSHLVAMCAAFIFRNFLTSAVDIGVLVITVKLWKDEVNPYMQAIQAMFALGGIVSPLITAPFLSQAPSSGVDINDDSSVVNNDSYLHMESSLMLSHASLQSNESPMHYRNRTFELSTETNVYIAYSIIGGAMLLSAVPISILWITNAGEKLIRNQNMLVAQREQLDPELQKKPTRFLPLAIVLVAVFFFVYGPVEKTSANFLMAFLVKHLNWSKVSASQGSSAFYSGFAAGRFIGIALALLVPTTAMLFLFMISLVGCLGLFIIAVQQSAIFVWICIVLTGVAMSTIYASMYAWVDVNVTSVSGKMASAMQVMLALGAIASTPLIGYLFKKQTPLWYLYLSIASASTCLIAYSALYRVTSTLLRKNMRPTQEEAVFLDTKLSESISN